MIHWSRLTPCIGCFLVIPFFTHVLSAHESLTDASVKGQYAIIRFLYSILCDHHIHSDYTSSVSLSWNFDWECFHGWFKEWNPHSWKVNGTPVLLGCVQDVEEVKKEKEVNVDYLQTHWKNNDVSEITFLEKSLTVRGLFFDECLPLYVKFFMLKVSPRKSMYVYQI